MQHISSEKHNIFCIWSGNNDMSDNRKKCLYSIIKNSGCDINLITPYNLKNYVVNNHPIHPAYEYLSLTHRADYLRVYLMYHYGGGYSDIKLNNFDWTFFFDKLKNSDKQFIGYREQSKDSIASNDPNVRNSYHYLPGVVYFIFKQQSIFAKKWLNSIESVLSHKLHLLQENPGHYHPRAVYGGIHGGMQIKESKYPLEWNEILGRIFHEMCYKDRNSFSCDMPPPNVSNYI